MLGTSIPRRPIHLLREETFRTTRPGPSGLDALCASRPDGPGLRSALRTLTTKYREISGFQILYLKDLSFMDLDEIALFLVV